MLAAPEPLASPAVPLAVPPVVAPDPTGGLAPEPTPGSTPEPTGRLAPDPTAGSTPEPTRAPELRLVPAAAVSWTAAWWAVAEASGFVVWMALTSAVVALSAASAAVAVARWGPGSVSTRLPDSPALLSQIALVGCAVTLVLGAAAWQLTSREAGPLQSWARDRATATVVGRVSGDAHEVESSTAQNRRWVVRLVLDRVSARDRTVASGGEVVVIGGPEWATVPTGRHVMAEGRLSATERGDDAVALLAARSGPQPVASAAWPLRAAERLRRGLREASDGLPADAAGLLPALAVGDTSALSATLRSDLRAAGLTHLTAVSGGNVAIVGAAVAGVGVACRARRRAVAVAVLLAVAAFVVVARPEPSVLRAAVMGGVAVSGVLLSRRPLGVPALAASVILLLTWDPWLARSYGFALSALATGALLLLAPAWVARWTAIPRPVALAIAVPVAAQVATAPVVVLLQPSVSMVGVPANLLAAPAVAPATVAGLVAALVSPVSAPLAHLVAWPGGLATWWIAVVAHRAAAVPGGSLPWLPGTAGALLLAAVGVLAVWLSLRRRRGWRGIPDRARRSVSRRAVLGALGLIGAGLSADLLVSRPPWTRRGRWPPTGWIAVQCDVGQGDAMVLRSGPNRAVLVDTGPDPALVDRCLRRLGIRVLDLVVVTHFHADHATGLAGALRGRGVPPILVSPFAAPAQNVDAVRRAAREAGCEVVVAAEGVAGRSGEGDWAVDWRVVWPPPGVEGACMADGRSATGDGQGDGQGDGRGAGQGDGQGAGQGHGQAECGAGDAGTVINNASLVLVTQLQGVRVVALGDVETAAQEQVVERLAGYAPADVVKVAHHGSASQHPPLYSLLRPRIALVGVGAGNDYGHPVPSTMAMVRAAGATVLRTDRQGDLAVVGGAVMGGGGPGGDVRLGAAVRGDPLPAA